MHRLLIAFAITLGIPQWCRTSPAHRNSKSQEIDPHVGEVCYAVTVADVNGDQKRDVVAVTEDAVVSYENPSWRKADIIRKATARDNVCIHSLTTSTATGGSISHSEPAKVRRTRKTPAPCTGWAATNRADGKSTRFASTSPPSIACAGAT